MFILFPAIIYSQKINNDNLIVNRNIFRLVATEPLDKDYETSNIVSFNYEHKIRTVFSLVSKLGIATSVKKTGTDSNPYRISFHLYSSIEGRYYFTLKRRLRKEKSILNFSGPYIGFEQNLFTNPIALINQTKKNAFEGYTATYLNLGYQ